MKKCKIKIKRISEKEIVMTTNDRNGLFTLSTKEYVIVSTKPFQDDVILKIMEPGEKKVKVI